MDVSMVERAGQSLRALRKEAIQWAKDAMKNEGKCAPASEADTHLRQRSAADDMPTEDGEIKSSEKSDGKRPSEYEWPAPTSRRGPIEKRYKGVAG